MVSILSRGVYRAVAMLTLNALIVFVCLELAAMGLSKIKTLSVISKPTEQLTKQLVGEGNSEGDSLVLCLSRLG